MNEMQLLWKVSTTASTPQEVQCHFTTWSRKCIQGPHTFLSSSWWWLKESSRGSRGIPRLPFGQWEQHCQRSLSVSQLLQECAMITYTDLQTMKSDATFTIYCLLWCAMMLNQLRLPCATQDWIPGYWIWLLYTYIIWYRENSNYEGWWLISWLWHL